MKFSIQCRPFYSLIDEEAWLRGRGDMIFTSSPYNANVPYENYNDKLTHKEFMELALDLGEFASFILKPGAPLFLNVAPVRHKFFEVIDFVRYVQGWRVQNWITWLKSGTTPLPGGDEFSWGQFTSLRHANTLHSTFEWVFQMVREDEDDIQLDRLALGTPYADKANLKRYNHEQDLRCRGNTWCIRYETKNKRTHPATFPPDLAAAGIKLAGLKPGSVVIDPFCGEGNTGVAALRLGHNFIGTDIGPTYVATANEKCERALHEQLQARN